MSSRYQVQQSARLFFISKTTSRHIKEASFISDVGLLIFVLKFSYFFGSLERHLINEGIESFMN